MRALIALALAALAAACSDDETHPPEFSPDANVAQPRTCAEVRKGEVKGGVVWVEGAPAACGPNAQECPVFDLDTFTGICKQGVPYATCKEGRWVVHCNQDAGATDAGATDAGATDAGATDGSTDADSG